MLALLMLISCKESTTVATAAATNTAVNTAAVVAVDWTPSLELSGSVEPLAMVQLGFDVPGRISALLVQRGQRVSKGDAIARLDARMASAQLAQAEAAYNGAAAQVEAAELSWGRVQRLKEAGGISEQVYTDTQGQISAAYAGLSQAKAAVTLAQTYVANHTLRSPIDGIVTNGPDNAGMMVGAGTPIFVIEDLSSLRLKGTVGEESAWVAAGQKATVKSGPPGMEILTDAQVLQVIPSLDPSTRRVPVELSIAAPPTALKAHSFARATIKADQALQVWSIPTGALVARPDFSVFTVSSPEAAPVRVPVAVLERAEKTILVSGNLTAGTLVVVDPAYSYGIEQ